MKNTALIFDLDDTLLDQTWMTTRSIAYVGAPLLIDAEAFAKKVEDLGEELFPSQEFYGYCRHIGISPGEVLWGEFGGPGEGLKALRTHGPGFRHLVWQGALKAFGITDEAAVQQVDQTFRRLRQNFQFVHPGVRGVLTELKKSYHLGILTNGAPQVQWLKIGASGLADLFDEIVVSGDYGVGKPDPQIFEVVRDLFKTRAQRFVMIGNSLSSDIRGANNAGDFLTVWVDRSEETPGPEHTIHKTYRRIQELPAVLADLLK